MNSCRALTLLRRSYSTKVTPKDAQKASLPLQVALRRTQTATLELNQNRARYELLVSKGKLMGEDGTTPTYTEWLKKVTSRRRQIRGTRKRFSPDAPEEVATEVVGQKIYLPNIIFRLMRNHTPPGQPYNPYEATFRIPRSVTKMDVRSYLSAVYGVQCTYIRTDNYIAPLKRQLVDGHKSMTMRSGGSLTTYKRAVVGLVEPFVYPNAVEDMMTKEREEHEDWMETMFQTKTYAKFKQEKKQDGRTGRVGPRAMTNRGRILQLVMEKRRARDQMMKEAVSELVTTGASPFVRPSVEEKAS